ncbi:sulfurtransferase [Thalassoglobus polymorphus]|uniref:tRNA uridine(34) hydroxylase n=1 Tax=Thalassoglobus polymorphus TaxID=2527994 RepID=A0A517QH22_9PLAN|nr:sulfurtransferase [Thalassoglobus polymorphus]QDT30847.1 Ribosomal large subunit pseudouridine synthase C [Thalassoglobus polymorphus]
MSPDVSSEAECSTSQVGNQQFVNIAAYQFVSLDQLERRREELRELCNRLALKGTILLTPEGINLFLAGSREAIDEFLSFIRSEPTLAEIPVKESFSDYQPFERMLVKIKEEIIAFGVDGVDPREKTSKKLPATKLKEWLDAGKEMILLDTRNDYEVRVGTFEDALPIGVDHFRDFPKAVEKLPEETKERPIVMFCTGGIRCEKAGPFMEQAGFKDVYQLEGGILKYFEECGGEHYTGECFVFDKRVALDPALKETETTQCYACLAPLTKEDQLSDLYDPPHGCPHCHESPEQKQQKKLQQRLEKLQEVTNPLPGSVPYENALPLNVPAQFDQSTLLEFLTGRFPQFSQEHWQLECDQNRIQREGKAIPSDQIVRAGNQFAHLVPATVEPAVSTEISILHEDESLVVVNKPAPLPIHPSGRFHRNTLQWILNEVYHPFHLRPAHRLDANTTGVVVFCKTRSVSKAVQPQFTEGSVEKVYLARVQGEVDWESRTCSVGISREAGECGGRVVDNEDGLKAETHFERVQHFDDGTTLLRVVPKTGRTNQIRVHLWHLGHPIVGDPLYLPEQRYGETQTHEPGQEMCLHALELTLLHPDSEQRVAFSTAPPEWSKPS